jgi:hypothetical protein
MTNIRLGGTIFLGLVLLALTVLYAFFQPFEPDAVLEAIPAQVSFVHQVDHLDELLESPVCTQLDKALGAGNSLKALLPETSWRRRACPAEIAVVDLPFRRAGERKAWAAVCWSGWRSPWLRWRLEHSRKPELTLLGKHAAWPVWRYDASDIARGSSLTFALTDRLFIVCLSENPADILLMLDAYDQRLPSIAQIEQ